MAATWEIVGGADKGGILVREGKGLKSPAAADRLSTGAIVEQIAKEEDRLHYKLISGTGPKEGWISVRISGKDLAVPKTGEAAPAAAAPAAGAEASKEGAKAEAPKAGEGAAPMPSKIKEARPWVKTAAMKGPPQARFRLVIFNWTGNRGGAGAQNQFKPWQEWLDQDSAPETWEVCEVQLPGQGSRMKEPCATSAAEVAAGVVEALGKAGHLAGTVLCGFSFGAVLAYETAALLEAKGERVMGLVVASAEHPAWEGRIKGAGPPYPPTKDMSDSKFEQMLRDKKGTDMLLANEDMKRMYLPTVRAAMLMEEKYGADLPKHDQLSCPIVVFRGKKCPLIAPGDAEPWLKCSAVGDQRPSRVEELETGLEPNPQQHWLSDWYLMQSQASAQAIAKSIATDFGAVP